MGCAQSAEDKAKIDQLSKDVDTKKTQIDVLKADLDKSMAKAKEADSAESRIEALSREKKELETNLTDLTQQRDRLEALIRERSDELEALKAQLDTESRAKSDLAAEFASLRAQLDADSSTKADLSAQITALQAELQDAKSSHSSIEVALEALRKEKDGLMDKISHLGSKIPSFLGGGDDHDSKKRDCLKMSHSARIGVTGLYYCGQRMKGENDICGPMTGTNCKDCQKLDRESRDLPKGFLMNGQGRICRHGGNGSDWYCGAGVLQGVPGCDGYCGPTNGPNCPACQEMAALSAGRYHKLL